MKKISQEILYRGRWLSLRRAVYANSRDQEVEWESVERENNACSFGILAKLVPSQRYILIKQFRQAIDNFVIGLPAGIADPRDISGEQWSASVLADLKEETGYTGTVKARSPLLKLNPALMDNDFMIVSVEIDENAPENLNVRQQLEPAEEIEVILLKKPEISAYLREQIKQGTDISSGVWFLVSDLS